MNNKHTVFLIIGQTASGKDSLVNAMCKTFKPVQYDVLGKCILEPYTQLISYTTRPRRTNESDTHIFIDKSDVEQYKDDMIAYTKIGEYEYFATKQQLANCDFYIIDYNGVEYLRSKHLDDEFRFVTIYINTPERIRKERALSVRKDNADVFTQRNNSEFFQFERMRQKADFDYSINNIDFNKSQKILQSIVEVETANEEV